MVCAPCLGFWISTDVIQDIRSHGICHLPQEIQQIEIIPYTFPSIRKDHPYHHFCSYTVTYRNSRSSQWGQGRKCGSHKASNLQSPSTPCGWRCSLLSGCKRVLLQNRQGHSPTCLSILHFLRLKLTRIAYRNVVLHVIARRD